MPFKHLRSLSTRDGNTGPHTHEELSFEYLLHSMIFQKLHHSLVSIHWSKCKQMTSTIYLLHPS